MHRVHAVLCLHILLFSSFACAQEGQDPMLKQLMGAADSQIGSLDVHGRVVSSDGQPLEDVTIQYYFRDFGDVLSRREVDRMRMRIDGDFRIKRRNFSSANLTFLKEGFYTEKWSFVFDETTPRKNPGGYERINIEIVMKTRPEPAPLDRFEGLLRTDAQGLVSVVEIKRKGSRETFLRRDGEQTEIKWPYVFLEARVTSENAISSTRYVPKGKRAPIDALADGRIRLSQPDPGDGFVIYDPGEISLRVELGFRGMVEAPEGGYFPDLVVSTPDSPQKVFFYCRMNGLYGKGMVSGRPAIVVEDDREVAIAGIVVYLNPKGSRNVASIHD